MPEGAVIPGGGQRGGGCDHRAAGDWQDELVAGGSGLSPAGVVVLRTTGVPGGQPGLANLADLFDPVAGMVLPGLPGPQAAALRVALGLAAAEMPLGGAALERAVVAVMRGLAETGVMVAVDDVQWVDEDTRRLLEAAAVRLRDAPVRWLVSARSGHDGRGAGA